MENEAKNPSSSPSPTPPAFSVRRWAQLLALAVVAGVAIGGAIHFLRPEPVNGWAIQPASAEPPVGEKALVGWDKPTKPDLVLFISGQMHAHLQPCGCSDPQYGGLARRYNFLKSLRDKNWQVVPIDLGEISGGTGPQTVLKYEYSMKALAAMGYAAVGLGKSEFNMPLFTALGAYSLNNPLPIPLGTNLPDAAPTNVLHGMNVRQYAFLPLQPQSVGIYSVTDPTIQQQVVPQPNPVLFAPAAQALADVLKTNRAAVNVVMYQGTDDASQVGKFLQQYQAIRNQDPKLPDIYIVLCLSAGSEPPGRAKVIGKTTVISVGWKGRYVGVIGLFRQQKSFASKYELVSMGPEWATPEKDADKHPINKIMEEYTRRVKDDGYIKKFRRGPHPLEVQLKAMNLQTTYVGSQECKRCHQAAYAIWEKSKHAHAFDSLSDFPKHAKPNRPRLRQFDGECVVCHTVGFEYNNGYLAPANNQAMNDKLINVGCESCHGPGGAHVDDKRNEKVRELMNPWSIRKNPDMKVRFERLQDDFCQKCHDQENDVHFSSVPINVKWKIIEHMTPRGNAPVGQPAVEEKPK